MGAQLRPSEYEWTGVWGACWDGVNRTCSYLPYSGHWVSDRFSKWSVHMGGGGATPPLEIKSLGALGVSRGISRHLAAARGISRQLAARKFGGPVPDLLALAASRGKDFGRSRPQMGLQPGLPNGPHTWVGIPPPPNFSGGGVQVPGPNEKPFVAIYQQSGHMWVSTVPRHAKVHVWNTLGSCFTQYPPASPWLH